ncbi:MAG: sulfotransferase [Candidatus Eisenbacteria bacterium]|nr:sulfotransferase [Candidatus Eisenbacteria bacterium]
MPPLENPPIFVVGHPRSGTTWLTRLLGEHPRLASGGETHLFNLYLEKLLRERERWLDDWVDEETLRGLIRDLAAGVFRAALEKRGKVRVVEKTPTHRYWIAEIDALFPGALFVHSVRDGRDVTLSLLRRRSSSRETWIPRTTAGCARAWRESVELLRREGERLGPERMIEVRYETLVREPRAELGRLLRFLGEEVPDSEIERILAVHPPRTKSLEKWRRAMSPWARRRFRSAAGATLESLGYPLR